MRETISRGSNYDCGHVRLGKIVALEEQWLVRGLGQRVGAAIAEVQSCWMVAFAEPLPGIPGNLKLGLIERNDDGASALKQ